ncbi:hypothetical protein L1987_68999 [Smallanthus sonchifolius]|uniref:Uncharacterized protein n=1 Tax=Smallanthus sonchifolius TaxID=185202 RepID=A0ACB9B4Q7_9ASTR|nr:hypothetical protein L1987_68999 [Smallanthus sonchifolius]
MEGPSAPFQLCTRSDFQYTLWIQRSSCILLLSMKWRPLVLKLEVFSESSFSDDDIFAVYRGLDLGNPLFGRVDSGVPKILHMRDVYGRVDEEGKSKMACTQTQLLLMDAMIYSKDVAADSLKAIRRKLVPADNLKQSVANSLLLMDAIISSKDVAADSLKAIRRKLVLADNLKQSVVNSLLLMIKLVSS